MTEIAERIEDRLADFTRDKRILLLSLMAVIVGATSALVAKALVWLIAIFTNLTFYQRFSSDFISPTNHHLGALVIFAPVVGGLIIGLLARYGSEKIRGHGIPEALEAILFGRSLMSVKVALPKPLSSAISIGSGGPFGSDLVNYGNGMLNTDQVATAPCTDPVQVRDPTKSTLVGIQTLKALRGACDDTYGVASDQ